MGVAAVHNAPLPVRSVDLLSGSLPPLPASQAVKTDELGYKRRGPTGTAGSTRAPTAIQYALMQEHDSTDVSTNEHPTRQQMRAIEIHAELRDDSSSEAPAFDVEVDFRNQGDPQPDSRGERLASAMVSTSDGRPPADAAERNFPSRLRTIIQFGPISAAEWRDAITENQSTHNCQDPYCALTQVATRRLKSFCTQPEEYRHLWPSSALRRVTIAPSSFKVRLVVPVCPLGPPEETPQDIAREYTSPETRYAFTNVRTLYDGDDTAVCVLVRPDIKTVHNSVDYSVVATNKHGKATGSWKEDAAKAWIESALSGYSPTQEEWDEAEQNGPTNPSDCHTLTLCVTSFLDQYWSASLNEAQREEGNTEQDLPEMTVMVALAKSQAEL